MWNSSIGKANDKRRTCHNTHEYAQENITTFRKHLPTTDRPDLRRAADQGNLNGGTRRI